MIDNKFVILTIIMSLLCVYLFYNYWLANIKSCNCKIKPKLIFIYDSSKFYDIELLKTIQLKYKLNQNIDFIIIDVFNNKKYEYINYTLPLIYFIDYITNIILTFPNDKSLNTLNFDNFIITSFGMINN